MTAESAQPRKASNVTRHFPVLWVGSGDETSQKWIAKTPTYVGSECRYKTLTAKENWSYNTVGRFYVGLEFTCKTIAALT